MQTGSKSNNRPLAMHWPPSLMKRHSRERIPLAGSCAQRLYTSSLFHCFIGLSKMVVNDVMCNPSIGLVFSFDYIRSITNPFR